MKYVYNDIAELKDIIARLHDGESKTFSIYDKSGKRVKYDFYKNMATKVLIDDGVEQDNPYYKEPVAEPELTVEEADIVTPIEEVDDIPADTQAEVVDGVDIVPDASASDEVAPDASEEASNDTQVDSVDDEPEAIEHGPQPDEDRISASVQELLNTISDRDAKIQEQADSIIYLNSVIDAQKSALNDKGEELAEKTTQIANMSDMLASTDAELNKLSSILKSADDVNWLVDKLVNLGFKVTLSK